MIKEGNLRIFYMNVNELDLGRQESHNSIQLYMNLKEKEANGIYLSETNCALEQNSFIQKILKISTRCLKKRTATGLYL